MGLISKILDVTTKKLGYTNEMSYSEYNRKMLVTSFVAYTLDILLCFLVLLLLDWGDGYWAPLSGKNLIATLIYGFFGASYRVHKYIFVALSFWMGVVLLYFLWSNFRCKYCRKSYCFFKNNFDAKIFWKMRLCIPLVSMVVGLGFTIFIFVLVIGILLACLCGGGSSEETLYDEYGNEVRVRR